MRPWKIVLLCVVGVWAFVAQASFIILLFMSVRDRQPANNNMAVAQAAPFFVMNAPAPFAPLAAAAQPCTPDEVQQARGDAVPTSAYEVSAPVRHANLSVFFIHGPDAMQQKMITLQDAVSQNLAVVHEGSVQVENRSTLPLFIQGGDIIKGGHQDRVVPYDYIIPAGARTALAVFCVEAGRSSPRGDEHSSSFQVASNHLPTRELKLAALVHRSQQQVWIGVGQTQANLTRNLGSPVQSTQSQTSLQLTLEHPTVQQAALPFLAALDLPARPDVIGCAVAVNGRLQSADVYGSAELFRAAWPKLLQASAVAALAERQSGADISVPQVQAVRSFLAAPELGQASRQSLTSNTQLLRHESAANILLETCMNGANSTVIHRTFCAR
jgi:hypothetical protein